MILRDYGPEVELWRGVKDEGDFKIVFRQVEYISDVAARGFLGV
jgi:hypothetical protein